MSDMDDLDALSSRELHDLAVHRARHHLDVAFLWELLRALPAGEAVAGHPDHASADALHLSALIGDVMDADDSDVADAFDEHEERVRRLGEVARILTDSGQIFLTTITDADVYDVELLKALNAPNEILVVVVGSANFQNVHAHVQIPDGEELGSGIERVCACLREQAIIPDFCI